MGNRFDDISGGETVVYTASCNGYVTKTGAIAVAAGQEDVNIVLAKPSENDVTIKIVVLPMMWRSD